MIERSLNASAFLIESYFFTALDAVESMCHLNSPQWDVVFCDKRQPFGFSFLLASQEIPRRFARFVHGFEKWPNEKKKEKERRVRADKHKERKT